MSFFTRRAITRALRPARTGPRMNSTRRRPALETLESRQLLAFVVTNAADSGIGSLRWAIDKVNGTSGVPDVILFKIPGPGLHTITPLSALPPVTHTGGLVIDGYTQPGSAPNTLAVGDNAVLNVALDGRAAGLSAGAGLVIQGGSTTVRGLIVDGFSSRFVGSGIELQSDKNKIVGNFFGTNQGGSNFKDPSGSWLGNRVGVVVRDGASNVVGGLKPTDRNLISDNVKGGKCHLIPIS
jgi:hypothetical protein